MFMCDVLFMCLDYGGLYRSKLSWNFSSSSWFCCEIGSFRACSDVVTICFLLPQNLDMVTFIRNFYCNANI